MLGVRSALLGGVARIAGALPPSLKALAYRMPVVTTLARRLLTRAAPDGLSEVTVASGLLRDLRLLVNLKNEKYYWLGTYEQDLQHAIEAICRPGMVVYDVGGHIGYTALAFARCVGPDGLVYTFEPNAQNLSRLRRNVELNGLGERIAVQPYAVSASSGEAEFLVASLGAMGRLAGVESRPTDLVRSETVETVSLDDFLDVESHRPPDVVKLDIEGAGSVAAAGMRKLIAAHRPVVILEVHGPEEDRALTGLLAEFTYELRELWPMSRPLDPETRRDWRYQCVALPVR